MAEGPGDDDGVLDERTQSIRKLRELVRGRLTDEEVYELLNHHDWELDRATNAFLNSDPKDLQEMFNREDENELQVIQKDEVIRDLLRKHEIVTETRQFACQPCDHTWWRKVPARKMVSKCKKCRKRYNAIPRNQEWGWAIFLCSCGREFSGFGQMGVTRSECYVHRGGCGEMALPDRIRPPTRRGRKQKSRTKHSCDAPDCLNQHDSDGGHNLYGGNDEYPGVQLNHYSGFGRGQFFGRYTSRGPAQRRPFNQRGRRGRNPICIHPMSRQNKPKVIIPSEEHMSTGSTVNTFLDQGDLCSLSSFQPSEDDIDEGSGSGDEESHEPG
ncbi:hypothetical protein CHS0354_040581 [Potamilus streckersoni]|uniref:Uncharacterized protein n=1 Tax=Potamilus streckersoni TaxID=2493646 RepID=A0AAE0SGL5_9BIVA|nr:hypothetical protein CHS0354_040581 [Potamilus streckersoni]